MNRSDLEQSPPILPVSKNKTPVPRLNPFDPRLGPLPAGEAIQSLNRVIDNADDMN
jgi:hypothetical protein